jgi:predicted RNase H-like nuclease
MPRPGWLGIVLDHGHCEALCAPRIADLVAGAGPVEGIAIDIPIGLLDQGCRTTDAAARARIEKLGALRLLHPGQVSAER